MAYQNRENLAYATVAVAPSPAASGTSLTVANGLGSLFPTSNFQITVYPPGVDPLYSNAEICTVSSRTGDVFTIVRAQEGTLAKSIATGWQVANTITKKAFTDIQDSIIQSVWAGGVAVTAPQVSFSNANNVVFGAAGSVVTASASFSGGGIASVVFSAGTSSGSLSSVVFSNSNGVTFGLSDSIITASHNGLTSQSNQAFSAQGGSSTFQTLGFSNANGATFSNSNGSVALSYTVPSTAGLISRINVSAGTTSNNLSAVTFDNANGVTFGLNGSVVTASVGAGVAAGSISAGTTNVVLGEAVFSNSNGVTFGLDGSTVTASHNGLTSQSNQAASASNGSFTFQTLGFSNANNVTFGTSAGSIITASVDTGGAAGVTLSAWQPYREKDYVLAAQFGNSFAAFAPIDLAHNVTFDRVVFPVNIGIAAAASTVTVSQLMGIYTRNVSSLSLAHSSSTSLTIDRTSVSSSLYVGYKNLTMGWSTSLTPGNYYVGLLSLVSGAGITISNGQLSLPNSAFAGLVGQASAASNQLSLGLGYLSATTSALPSVVAATDLVGRDSGGNRPQVFFATAGSW